MHGPLMEVFLDRPSRATEGDLVRINFINNGSKEHTIHFHGIHPAGMDGVFEPVGGGGGTIHL